MNDVARFTLAEATRALTMPSAGFGVQARLGVCETAESFVTDPRELDIVACRAQVAAAQEARRRTARLDATAPVLDDRAQTSQLTPLHVVRERGTSRPTP